MFHMSGVHSIILLDIQNSLFYVQNIDLQLKPNYKLSNSYVQKLIVFTHVLRDHYSIKKSMN